MQALIGAMAGVSFNTVRSELSSKVSFVYAEHKIAKNNR